MLTNKKNTTTGNVVLFPIRVIVLMLKSPIIFAYIFVLTSLCWKISAYYEPNVKKEKELISLFGNWVTQDKHDRRFFWIDYFIAMFDALVIVIVLLGYVVNLMKA